MAAVVVLTSVLVVGGATEKPVKALAACTPDRTATNAGSTYVEFTTVTAGCTWTIPSGVTSLTEVLIVAGGGGGGGGGKWAGGAGAGEVISLSSVAVSSSVDISVGGGGTVGFTCFGTGGLGIGAKGVEVFHIRPDVGAGSFGSGFRACREQGSEFLEGRGHGCGVLLHNGGIIGRTLGDFGKSLHRFADFLHGGFAIFAKTGHHGCGRSQHGE